MVIETTSGGDTVDVADTQPLDLYEAEKDIAYSIMTEAMPRHLKSRSRSIPRVILFRLLRPLFDVC